MNNILSPQYLRRNNICDLSWKKINQTITYNTSFAGVNTETKLQFTSQGTKTAKKSRVQKSTY